MADSDEVVVGQFELGVRAVEPAKAALLALFPQLHEGQWLELRRTDEAARLVIWNSPSGMLAESIELPDDLLGDGWVAHGNAQLRYWLDGEDPADIAGELAELLAAWSKSFRARLLARFALPMSWERAAPLRSPLPPPELVRTPQPGWAASIDFRRYPPGSVLPKYGPEYQRAGQIGDGDWEWLATALRYAVAVGSGRLALTSRGGAWVAWHWHTTAFRPPGMSLSANVPLWTEGKWQSSTRQEQWWPSKGTERTLSESLRELRSSCAFEPKRLSFAYRGRGADKIAQHLREPALLDERYAPTPLERTRNPVLGVCRSCGRPLTDPVSAELGLGPTCAERAGYWFRRPRW